jgi:DNA-binding CsgD family transcriptional regulator
MSEERADRGALRDSASRGLRNAARSATALSMLSLLEEIYGAAALGRVEDVLSATGAILRADLVELSRGSRSGWVPVASVRLRLGIVRRRHRLEIRPMDGRGSVFRLSYELGTHDGEAVDEVAAALVPHLRRALATSARQEQQGLVLPRRLRQAAILAARGRSARQIAVELGVTIPTARTYLSRVYRLLGVHNRVELVWALAQHEPPRSSTPGSA